MRSTTLLPFRVSIPGYVVQAAWATLILSVASQFYLVGFGLPIPFTLQVPAVLWICATLPCRLAQLSVAQYLLLGASGVPVFAEHSGGLAHLFGPSAGYLWGFLILASTGWLSPLERLQVNRFLLMKMLLGNGLIWLCGFWMLQGYVGAQQAWRLGVAPFLLVDTGKVVVLWMAMRQVLSER